MYALISNTGDWQADMFGLIGMTNAPTEVVLESLIRRQDDLDDDVEIQLEELTEVRLDEIVEANEMSILYDGEIQPVVTYLWVTEDGCMNVYMFCESTYT